MKDCFWLDMYLARCLSGDECARFEAHLKSCRTCARTVHQWREAQGGLVAALDHRLPGSPGDGQVRSLVAAARVGTRSGARAGARGQVRGLPWRRLLWAAPAVVAATVLVVGIPWLSSVLRKHRSGPGKPTSARPLAIELISPPHTATVRDNMIQASMRQGVVIRLGPARIGLDASSRLSIARADTRAIGLRLEAGAAAIDLPPAHNSVRNSPRFSLLAGRYQVSVVGTRFWVSVRNPDVSIVLKVGVARGVVRVDGPGGFSRSVRAGQTLSFDRLAKAQPGRMNESERRWLAGVLKQPTEPHSAAPPHSSPKTGPGVPASTAGKQPAGENGRRSGFPAAPTATLPTLEKWVLKGQYRRAERHLVAHLARAPTDVRAWRLLAGCRRKTGRWSLAIRAYRKVISLGSPLERNRSRYLVGAILQDRLHDHRRAVLYFEAYLRKTPLLRPHAVEARLRLARSLIKLGKLNKATRLLRRIIKEQRGLGVAQKAQRLLKSIKKPAEN